MSQKLKVLGLFSGIGGFELGLQRAGFEISAMCEIEPFCRRVLAKHWPEVPCFNDVKTIARQTWSGSKAQMSLRRVFRVRTYHTLAKVPDYPASVLVSGGRFAEPFAWYDHGSRCWRTWQRCLIEGWERYSEAWPRSGMTRNGIAYRLQPLVPITSETERGSWPTPTAVTATGGIALCKWGGAGAREKLKKKVSAAELNGPLNPEFAGSLMGYPTAWSDVTPSETQSSLRSRFSSAKRSSKASKKLPE